MLHILPPVEPILALWTTPFFQTGTAIPTSSQSVPTIYGYMDSISTGVSGDLNTVSIVNGNQEFCKVCIPVYNIPDIFRVGYRKSLTIFFYFSLKVL